MMTLPPPDEKWGPLQSYRYGGSSDDPSPAPVLFFHGNGFSAHTYDTLLTNVAEETPIRAFDLQGHGASDDIPSVLAVRNWQLYRDNVAHAVNQNGGAILMGHSMGGLSSMFTAMKHPESVRALILLEPVFLSPRMTIVLGLSRMLGLESRGNGLIPQARARRQYFADTEEAATYFLGRKGLKTWPEHAIRNYAQSILRPRRDGQPGLELSLQPEYEAQNFAGLPAWPWPAKPLPMPVLLAHGGHGSSTVYKGRVDWLRERTPKLEVQVKPDAGHMMPVDAAEWTASVVRDFLRRLN